MHATWMKDVEASSVGYQIHRRPLDDLHVRGEAAAHRRHFRHVDDILREDHDYGELARLLPQVTFWM